MKIRKKVSVILIMFMILVNIILPASAEVMSGNESLSSYQDYFTEPSEYSIDLGDTQEMRFSDPYAAYYNVVQKCIEQYGNTAIVDGFNYGQQHFTGLSFLKTVDFNSDGNEELLLVFYAGEDGYVTNVWGFDGEKAVLLMNPRRGEYGLNGTVINIYLVNNAFGTFLLTGSADAAKYNYYYGYAGAEFGLAKYLETEGTIDGGCWIDGVSVSPEQWNAELNTWGTTESAQEAYWLCPYEQKEADKTLGEINATMQKLQQAGGSTEAGSPSEAAAQETAEAGSLSDDSAGETAEYGNAGVEVAFSYNPENDSYGKLFMHMLDEQNQVISQVDESRGGKVQIPLFVEGFGYRPWPLENSGGLNSKVYVERLSDGRILTELIYGVVAAGPNPPRVEAYYTVYSPDRQYGFVQDVQGIRGLFCEGNGNPAAYEACYLNGAECSWADIETAFQAYNVGFSDEEIQVGIGENAIYPAFLSASAGGEVLLNLATTVNSELPPTKEALSMAPAEPKAVAGNAAPAESKAAAETIAAVEPEAADENEAAPEQEAEAENGAASEQEAEAENAASSSAKNVSNGTQRTRNSGTGSVKEESSSGWTIPAIVIIGMSVIGAIFLGPILNKYAGVFGVGKGYLVLTPFWGSIALLDENPRNWLLILGLAAGSYLLAVILTRKFSPLVWISMSCAAAGWILRLMLRFVGVAMPIVEARMRADLERERRATEERIAKEKRENEIKAEAYRRFGVRGQVSDSGRSWRPDADHDWIAVDSYEFRPW